MDEMLRNHFATATLHVIIDTPTFEIRHRDSVTNNEKLGSLRSNTNCLITQCNV